MCTLLLSQVGVASQNWYCLGFGTVLLLLRSEFSRYPTETSQAENDHASFSIILLIERKLFGEGEYPAWALCTALSRW